MRRVAVVTDSTAYLPEGIAAKHDVGVVPLHVVLGLRTGAEGVEVSPADVAAALTERRGGGSTAPPAPAEVAAAHPARGSPRVVSLPLSRAPSRTGGAGHLPAARGARGGI